VVLLNLTYRMYACCCCRNRSPSERAANNTGQVGRQLYDPPHRNPCTALSVASSTTVGLPPRASRSTTVADDNFGHLRPDFIGGGNLCVYSDRRPIGAAKHVDLRQGARALGRMEILIKQMPTASKRPPIFMKNDAPNKKRSETIKSIAIKQREKL